MFFSTGRDEECFSEWSPKFITALARWALLWILKKKINHRGNFARRSSFIIPSLKKILVLAGVRPGCCALTACLKSVLQIKRFGSKIVPEVGDQHPVELGEFQPPPRFLTAQMTKKQLEEASSAAAEGLTRVDFFLGNSIKSQSVSN